ncbi:hypothetical protein HMI56_000675 [Coelomomyces lativittatus]|nr:hypothetical protein HMI56_000675 [Coelomomyces lativittatus]
MSPKPLRVVVTGAAVPELNPSCPNTIATLPGLNVQSFGCYGNSEAPSDLFCGSNIQCMASSTVGKPENENPQPEETPESIQQEGEAEKLRFSLWKLMILTLIFLLYLPFQ